MRRADAEVFVLIGADMAARAQGHPGFILGLLEGAFAALGLQLKRQAGARAAHAEKRREGNDDEIIAILPEDRSDFLKDTDNDELGIEHQNGLPYGIHAAE